MTRSPRRILHVLWSLEIGGKERAVYQLVREQQRLGHRADIAVASRAGLYGELAREAGAHVHELGQRSAADLTVSARAIGIFRQYDIVHLHSAEVALAGLAALAPARKVYTHRGGVSLPTGRRDLRYRVFRRIVRKRFAAISANTEQGARAASQLLHVPVEQVAVTYNGIDFDLLEPRRSAEDVRQELGIGETETVVGTSGSLRSWKRFDRVLRALSVTQDDRLRGLVVGDGPERTSLEQLADSLGVRGRVRFVGKQAHVGDYLQVMDVFTLPSGEKIVWKCRGRGDGCRHSSRRLQRQWGSPRAHR